MNSILRILEDLISYKLNIKVKINMMGYVLDPSARVLG